MVGSESRINKIPVLWWKKSNVEHSYEHCYELSVVLEEQDNLKQRLRLLRDQYVNQFAMDFVEFSSLIKKCTSSIISVSK